MLSALDSNESLSVFRSYCAAGDTNAPAFIEVGGEKVDVVALVLMPQSGWRDLSQRLGWEPAFLGCLDGIVEDWLGGTDRRELLALARNTRAPSALQSAHRELLALWLNEKRMERLELLTEALGHNRHFAHCYALSHAWRELVAALDHTNAMPAVEPSKPPALPDNDDAGAEQDTDTPVADADIVSWLA